MYQNVLIESLDHFGRGVAHINKKTIFISNALPKEVVDIEIIEDKKSYSVGKVVKYISKSNKRINSKCPYFLECGGCNLLFYEYKNTLEFKLNKVKELLYKNSINYSGDIEIISNEKSFNYRNKISLKIVNGKIGYFKEGSHKLVEIKECLVASKTINEVIDNYKLLIIENGSLTIRCNYNDEIILIINSDNDNYNIELEYLRKKIKIVGIIYNDKLLYGQDFFYERILGMLFKVSYNSFFQINPYITEKLFKLIEDNIESNSKILDLYSGVGTLSMVASKKASEVIGIEIVKNAVINASKNIFLNKRKNLKFMLGDVPKIIEKINTKFDTLIVDPPRSGLDKVTKNYIIENKPKKIIYVSCDVSTLMRDLKCLEELYELKTYKILDMFSYSYHLESFVVLELRK